MNPLVAVGVLRLQLVIVRYWYYYLQGTLYWQQ